MAGKSFIATLILTMAGILAHAQPWPFELWHDGKVVLTEGDTLKGRVKYDFQKDLVLLDEGYRQPEVYTARKVVFYEIFDETAHRYRQFYALPYGINGDYKAPVFFELLQEGKITLLSREFLETRNYSSPYGMGSYPRVILSNKYFFLKETGDIEEFNGTKNDLLNAMGKRGDEVEDYIRANHLRFEDKSDFARIVAYYNSLFGS
jgi:hypothetical protein